MKSILYIYLVFSLCCILIGCAHTNLDEIREPVVSKKMHSERITAFVMDDKGYMWIGTSEGISIFNGHQYNSYFHLENDPLSLISNQVRCLFKDSKGKIWIGTNDGICYYAGKGSFISVPIKGDHRVDQIVENSKGEIFLNIKGSIYLYDHKYGCFISKVHNINPNDLIYLYPDSNEGVWTIAPDVIYHYSSNFKMQSQYENMPESNIVCVASNKDSLWISTRVGGIKQLNLKTGDIVTLTETLPILPRSSTYHKGKLIYSSKDGIYSFDLKSKKTAPLSPEDPSISLNPQEISAWYVDCNQNLWVGSFNEGYQFINFSTPEFNKFKHSSLFQQTEKQSVISLQRDKHNNVWSVLSDGQIIRFNPHSNKTWVYRAENLSEPSFFQHKAQNILITDDKIWILTKTRVYRCHLENNKLVCEFIKKFGDKKTLLENAAISQWGDLVIATNQKKLLVLNNRDDQVEEIPIKMNSFGSNTVLSFRNTGELLLITEGMNLAVVNIKEHTFRHIPLSFEKKRQRVYPSSILTTREAIWIGTNNGLYLLDIHENKISHIESLPYTTITSIIENEKGHLWMGTHRGLVEYLPKEDRYIYYSTNSEANSYLSYNTGSTCLYSDSIFVFGHNKGVTIFSPSMMKQKNETDLYIERVVIRKNALKSKGIDLLCNPIDDISLKYNDNDIVIAFSSIDYDLSSLAYYYKMEGFDDDWIWAEDRRQASYPNLPPGDYTFRVKVGYLSASNSNIERQIHISVNQAPWFSTWAVLLYIVLTLLLIAYINKLYLRIKSGKLSALMAQKDKEREHYINQMNTSFFANISHEFRNPLTMIVGPVSILKKDYQLSKDAQKLIYIASQSVNQMLKLIDQMLDFNKLENDVLKLQVGRYDIIQEIETWVKRFEISAQEKNVQIKYTGLKSPYFALLDADKLDKILGNLFSNALKHTPQNGRIAIEALIISQKQAKDFFSQPCTISEKYLYISVSDSGPGIPDDMLEEVFKRYYQVKVYSENWGTGIGLYYVRQLIDLHKGIIRVKNSVSEGAIFYFILPLDESVYQESERMPEKINQPYIELEDLPKESLDQINQEEYKEDRPRILIIDDNINMSYYLRTILAEKYQVFNKYDAESALVALDEIAPELILLDVVMNGISGYELCRMLKENSTYCHIPIILITARSKTEEKVEGLTSGANAYVTKPFDPVYLQALVQTQIRNLQNIRKRLVSVTQIKSEEEENSLSPHDKALMDNLYIFMDQMILESELNMATICQYLRISRSKFFYKLKGLTGETPNNFFKKYKLNKAAELLKEGKYNVSEVSYMTGFSTISHFSVSFKKQFGINPSEYK